MAKVVYDRKSQRDIKTYSKLRDIYIRHGINLTRYSTHEARKLQGILDTANTQIKSIITKAKAIETKEKYHRVASEIKRITNELTERLDQQLEFDFKELAEEETRFVEKAMRSVNLTADFEPPAPVKVWSAASFETYAGYRTKETYESYLNTFGDNVFKTWDSNVRAGYMAGLTAQQINRAVLGSVKDMDPGQMKGLRKSLEMNTRTMVAHLAETARDATYKANSRLFSGYRYIGTLDSRTCLVCGELDGKIFEGSEVPDEPELPQHPNCRCLWLPEIKGMEGFDDDDERASVDGPVSANMTFNEWLKEQPETVQMDVLGPSRFAEFRKDGNIDQFVVDGRVLSLDELQIKEQTRVGVLKSLNDEVRLSGDKDNLMLQKYNDIINDSDLIDIQRYRKLDSLTDWQKENMNETVIKEYQKKMDISWDKFTTEQQSCIKSYTGMNFNEINKSLRDGLADNTVFQGKWGKTINNIQDAIKQNLNTDTIITRRSDNEFNTKDWEIGKVYSPNMFYSTSLNKGFSKAMQIIIKAAPGTGMYVGKSSTNPLENEFLMRYDVKYRVIAKGNNTVLGFGKYMILEAFL